MGLFRRRDRQAGAAFAGPGNKLAELEYQRRQLEGQHAGELRRRLEEDAPYERQMDQREADFERQHRQV